MPSPQAALAMSEQMVAVPDVVPMILPYASQGSLQLLSMTCKAWLHEAYHLTPFAWEVIDMGKWPWALKEYRDELAKQERQGDSDGSSKQESPTDDKAHDFSKRRPICGSLSCQQVDSATSDEDMDIVFQRIGRSCVKVLSCFSSQITNSCATKILQCYCTNLVSLSLGSAGSKLLSGKCLSALSNCLQLKRLEVHDLSGLPLASIAQSCDLHELCIRFDRRSAFVDVAAIRRFLNLQILKITIASTSRAGLPWQPFWDVFRHCKQLRIVNLYGSVEVSNGMLLCVMENLNDLQEFVGSRLEWGAGPREEAEFPFPDGPRVIDMSDLNKDVLSAFAKHYPLASRILVDDVFGAEYGI